MKELTKKVKNMLEEEGVRFDLTEGVAQGKADWLIFSIAGDLTNYEIRIRVADEGITILSVLVNAVKEEKYEVLLETLNKLNCEYGLVKFYALKDDEEESYYVSVQMDSVFEFNFDSEETHEAISFFLSVIEETYPQIIKAIA